MWRGRAWGGRAGQAFKLSEQGVVDGTTANSLAASSRVSRQDGQVAETKFLARNCLRILEQSLGHASPLTIEPAAWKKKPGTMAGLAQGWAGHSLQLTPVAAHFAWNTRSGRSRAAFGHALGGSGSGSDSLSLIR